MHDILTWAFIRRQQSRTAGGDDHDRSTGRDNDVGEKRRRTEGNENAEILLIRL